ncbi:hypothetical protein [Azospirillum doebereinerae]
MGVVTFIPEKATVSDSAVRPDAAVLDTLRRGLGDAVFHELLTVLVEELAQRLVSLRGAGPDRNAVGDDVRATLSLAATFGFGALAAASRSVLAVRDDATGALSCRLRCYRAEMHRLLELVIAVRRGVQRAVRADSFSADLRRERRW